MNSALSIVGFGSRAGNLLLVILLLVAHSSCLPVADEAEDEAVLPPDADYGHVDNVELHHVKIIDGVMHEDHPVVMYKEDFVSEDYDPKKNETSEPKHRRYKHIQRQRHRRPDTDTPPKSLETEKIYFDMLPEAPIASGSDDTDEVNFEAAQLVKPSKEEWLMKHPKKYHRRQRRNAYYRTRSGAQAQLPSYYEFGAGPSYYYLPVPQPQNDKRHPVRGKRPNLRGPLINGAGTPNEGPSVDNRIGGSDNDDGDLDLWHNSDPSLADFSKYDQNRPEDSPPPATDRPVWGGGSSGSSGSSDRRPVFSPPSTTTRRPRLPTTSAPKISTCVWAIVNCCAQNSKKIRYDCFEDFGCHGAFWGVNPCADNIRLGAISHVANSYS